LEDAVYLCFYPPRIIKWVDQQAAFRFEFHSGVLDHRSLCRFACVMFMPSMQCRVHLQWVGAVLWFAKPVDDRCILS
jgi:hypothetical protein